MTDIKQNPAFLWLHSALGRVDSADKRDIWHMAEELAAAQHRATVLEATLKECLLDFELVEKPKRVDPDYGDEVRELGERIGYGALMTSASASWRQSNKDRGYPVGGEFVAGPCHGTVLKALKMIRAALHASTIPAEGTT